jgi:CheY-like chemotaxis protein
MHTRSLLLSGYSVDFAHERVAALTGVLAKPVDILLAHPTLLDDAFVRRLRQHPQTESLGIVLLQDEEDAGTRVARLEAGADYVLAADVTASELDAVLQRLLRQRALLERALTDRENVVEVLHTLTQAVLLVDSTGRVALANEAAYRLLELQPDIVRLWTFDQILLAMGVPGSLAGRWTDPAVRTFEDIVEGQLGDRSVCVRVRSSAVDLVGTPGHLRLVVLEDLTTSQPATV